MNDFPALTLAQGEKVNRILGMSAYELLQEARRYAKNMEVKPIPYEDTACMLACLALANRNLYDLFPNQPPVKENERVSLSTYLFKKYRSGIAYTSHSAVDPGAALDEMNRSFWRGLERILSYLVMTNRSMSALQRVLGFPENNLSPASAEKIFLERVRDAFVAQFGPPRDYRPQPPIGGNNVIQFRPR